MRKVLSILFVSILLIGCTENRILVDELTNKGNDTESLMYYENELFNGISFNVYETCFAASSTSVLDTRIVCHNYYILL